MKREKVIRKLLRSINGSIQTIESLERDPPIIPIANLTRSVDLDDREIGPILNRTLKLATDINEYKRDYWKLELLIKQGFIDLLKKRGYLPGRSIEVESLRNELPFSLIKGDGRIWRYSYDHYISKIAEQVGRPVSKAPGSDMIWISMEKKYEKKIADLLKRANNLLPDIYHMRALLKYCLKNPDADIDRLKLKKVRVTPVERPIKKVIVIKRPIPLPKKGKRPKKRVIKKPEVKVIGPETDH